MNEQTAPFVVTAKKLTVETGGLEAGRWMAYTNGCPILVRETKRQALRDALYETNPFRCCGRVLRSYDKKQVTFHADRVDARCVCCNETQTRPL